MNEYRPYGQGQYGYGPQSGWVYDGTTWRRKDEIPPQQAAPQPPHAQAPQQPASASPQKGKRGKKVLAAIALVLVCAVAGFGGGYASIALFGGNAAEANHTVIYQVPEGSSGGSQLAMENTSLSNVAEQAGKSVVSITTENLVRDFMVSERVVSGAGSGVIISTDGYIITNNHVVEGAQNILVELADGTEYEATLVGTDPNTDVAVVKISATGLTPAVLGNSADVRVGDICLAIGNPLGTLGGTVTDGIISALDRVITIAGYKMTLLQMSAAVSPGNSGGGLFNSAGQLVGIVNAKSSGEYAEGLGFAIPIDTAIEVAEELMDSGYISRPGIGVRVISVNNEEKRAELGVTELGLYVYSVTEEGPADLAGVKPGDRMIAVDDTPVMTGEELTELLKDKEVGDEIRLLIGRDGEKIEIRVIVGELSERA